MDYINDPSSNLVLDIPHADLTVSQEYLDTIMDPVNIIQGFYISFSTENDWRSSWKEVTSTKTKTGVEIYINNVDLPVDYSDSNTAQSIIDGTHRYKTIYIGYKNLIKGDKVKDLVSFDIIDQTILHDLNTTIVFDTDIKCNLILNMTNELEYMKTLEDDIIMNDPDRYSIIDMKLKLQSYKNQGGYASGDINNGLLKY